MNQNHPIPQPQPGTLPPDKADTPKPSALCAWLAAAMPILFMFLGLIICIVSIAAFAGNRSDLWEAWADVSSLAKLMLLGVTLIAISGCTVLLALAGFGKRTPAVLLLGLAALPWIAGVLCSLLANRAAMDAFRESGAASISAVAAGLTEALLSRLTGSIIAGFLLLACAVGLGLAAIGQRAVGKRLTAVWLLLASSLPLYIFIPLWIFYAGMGSSGLLPVVVAGGGVMVAVLAGVGTSGSSPNFRNWPLAAAATAASWMSFMAAAAFCSSWSTILVFTNGARGEIPDPLGALTSVAKPIHTLFVTGGGLALLPVLLVAIWAITQVKIKSGWAVGAAACLVLAAGTLLVDQVTAKGISAFIQKLVSQGPSQSLTEIPTGKSDLTGLGVLTAPPSTPSYVPPMVAPKGENPKVEGGIPSGVPGGVTGGVVGGILGGQPPPPPPPAEKSTQQTEPIRLSSNVLMSKLIKHVAPVYPELARQARVQGVVSLRIIIDKTGHVANIAVVNGHPLLIQAATDAVSQWVFEATIINGEAVSVSGVVTVQFTLTGAKE